MSAHDAVYPVVQQVASALGSSEDFAELLACIPDSFFDQNLDQQRAGWKNILAQVIRGERNFDKIVSLANTSPAGGEL